MAREETARLSLLRRVLCRPLPVAAFGSAERIGTGDHLKIASYGICERDQIEMKLAIEFRTIKQFKNDTFMVEYLQ